MTSSNSELEKISTELKHISLKRNQLLEKKKIQLIFEEFRNHAEFRQTEEAQSNLEISSIEEDLKKLTEREAELQKHLENIPNTNTEVKDSTNPFTGLVVEAPPSFPAPEVYLDLENLPPHPCRTQCPECLQFVLTETSTSVSSVTWLACLMTAMLCCVAGCCFIPFCMEEFKSTTHKCPLCRTSIKTVKRL